MGSPWKALSDDSRRQMLLLLKSKEMTPSQIAEHFEFTLPAVSTHLRVLKEADLITEQRQGKNKFYSINQKQALDLMKFFENMWGYKLDSLKEFVENKEKKKKQ
ncbi:metalloregulator ArsR/SmtB family transcription factor [Candidatus Nitrosotenuis sp. DW1]|uniref:metalloregulator ArsR/SmtB family transcription factor n=1 Tax=Candidatus Nitrosotenuis sp. DW1 TaxID=2259672 RepID=UPI0015CDC20A|nr:metalloregulator ArsR/SmtB family transcription factor [Candidatus Nitrosotenuis sp. DW1]QLH08750.1 ArsR family transcriptional regulator [Candidatus Nitrosotenuis sp. DW1]